jgi:hypothetical protein
MTRESRIRSQTRPPYPTVATVVIVASALSGCRTWSAPGTDGLQPLSTLLSVVASLIVVAELTLRVLGSVRIGRIRTWYLRLKRRRLKRLVADAVETVDPLKMQELTYDLRIDQLGSPSADDRRLALIYLEEMPADPRVVKSLILALQKERHVDLKTTMACLLCTTLQRLYGRRQGRSSRNCSAVTDQGPTGHIPSGQGH